MTPAELATYVRLRTRTNSTTLADAEILSLLNNRIDEVAGRIADVDEDYFLIPQTRDLQEDVREYAFPGDILNRIKRAEAKFNGTDWIKLLGFDLANYDGATDETSIVARFSNDYGHAYYDIFRKSLYIYSGSIEDVTGGLKLWAFSYPAHVTDLSSTTDMSQDPTTTTLGIPVSVHPLLADGVVIDWKQSREKPIPLNDREQLWEFRLQKALDTLKHVGMDTKVSATLPPSSTRGNDGYDF